jgi:hypothetical protein
VVYNELCVYVFKKYLHTNEVETDGPKNWMLTLFGGANPGVEVAETGESLRCRLIRQKFVMFRLSDDLLG